MVSLVPHDGDARPTWVRWLTIGVDAMIVAVIILGVAVFLWPWVSAFS
jgi:hypothetical protein